MAIKLKIPYHKININKLKPGLIAWHDVTSGLKGKGLSLLYSYNIGVRTTDKRLTGQRSTSLWNVPTWRTPEKNISPSVLLMSCWKALTSVLLSILSTKPVL